MAQQTAVEWFYQRILANDIKEVFEQAQAMEKVNIIEAWDKRCTEGTFIGGWHIETKSGEEYYNETYNK